LIAAEKAQLEKELAEKEAKEKERQLAEEKRKNLIELEKKKHEEYLAEINVVDYKGKDISSENKFKEQEELFIKEIEKYVVNKNWDLVIETCNAAIEQIPNFYWAYYRLSTAEGNRGNFENVIKYCSKSIELNSDFAESFYNRATANFFKKNYQDAISDYEKSIELESSNIAEAYFNKGLCFQKLDLNKKAYREFLKAKDFGSKKAEELIILQYMNKQ
ncbi:MAG: hypothetical protein JXR51_09820, partial [Bacteroidales bacterium]|nr:hypothetical protein [Bacteroidales bacterium]MBN2757463.1 hypothetical protein [Bacteroidales bacterium]